MNIFQPFLADDILPTDVVPESWHWMGLSLKEILTVIGAAAAVTLLLVLWAVYVRKGPGRRSHHHHHHHHPEPADPSSLSASQEDAEVEGTAEKRYRRKRRKRREHRPRNPTLAETGGLPPLRSEPPRDPLP
jgi:hypothetical protein